MARYGRDYGGRGYDRGFHLNYNAGWEGLERERGGPTAQGWASMYPVRGLRGRGRGMGYGTEYPTPPAHGRYGRPFGAQGGRRFDLGYDRDYDRNWGDRLRHGWNEMRRSTGRFW